MRKVKERLVAFGHYIKNQASRLTAWMILSPIRFFVAALVLFLPLIFVLDLFWLKAAGGFGGVLVEAHGLVFDLIVFGIILTLYEHYRQQHENAKKAEVEKQQRIERYQEEIDDFRGWEGNEAVYRVVGNIRRLNKEGVSNISLIAANLANANLSGINLNGANLTNANLSGADLSGANLMEANLTDADLEAANLTGINLIKANLMGGYLNRANLRNADLSNASLHGTYLGGADLTNTNLSGAELIRNEGADFSRAKLDGANFGGSDF